MLLTLTLQGPARLMGAARSRTLSAGSLLIGRSPVCDWVLPDPDRIVSGRHCRIDSETNRFVVTDLSTNGVFLGEGGEPLGPGGTAELADGQVLRLGDARLLVQIIAAPSAGAPMAAAPIVSVPPLAGARPAEPASLIADDWFAPESTPALPEFDDLLAQELEPGASASFAASALPLEPLPEPGVLALDRLSGPQVLAALAEATAHWEPDAAARLRADLAAVLVRRFGSDRDAGPGGVGDA